MTMHKKFLPVFAFSLASIALIATILFFPHKTTTWHPPLKAAFQQEENNQISVIFDMNGVLVKTVVPTKVLKLNFFELLSMFGKKKKIKGKVYTFLEQLKPYNETETAVYDSDDCRLPQIMCDWLKGSLSSQEVLKKIDDHIDAWHDGDTKKIIAIMRMMFDPELFIQTQEWVPETIAFVQELKEQGIKVYILSNWDPKTFDLMVEKDKDILLLFDGIAISGDIGALKPDPAIYKKLLQHYTINPDYAIFLDDIACNVQAAEKLGIKSILVEQKEKWTGGKSPLIAPARKKCYELLYVMQNPLPKIA